MDKNIKKTDFPTWPFYIVALLAVGCLAYSMYHFKHAEHLLQEGIQIEAHRLANTEHGKLLKDLQSLSASDFQKAHDILLISSKCGLTMDVDERNKKMSQIGVAYHYPKGVETDDNDCLTCSSNFKPSGPDTKEIRDFCEKKGRETRETLRKKIPSLTNRPL
ncbi:MAG: hypothetical protein PHU42_02165 [Patescibacteria group bacterium]|nr:hypothetical protein [Patescibacteria group bacterium]